MPERSEPEPIRIGQRRVYILPTGPGLVFGACVAVMLLGSVNYALSLAYMLTFLLAATGLVASVHTFRNLAWLSVRAMPSNPVFAGGTARFTLQVDNPGSRDRYSIRAQLEQAVALTDLPRQSVTSITLDIPARHRGWQSAGPFTLETRYPLGLFRAWAVLRPTARVLVYPRPRTRPLPQASTAAAEAASRSRGPGQDEVADLRPYREGDALSHVAWKSLARGDLLFTRVLDATQSTQAWIDWVALPADIGTEDRLEYLSGWVIELQDKGATFGLRLPGTVIEPASGLAHVACCLERLALFPDNRNP